MVDRVPTAVMYWPSQTKRKDSKDSEHRQKRDQHQEDEPERSRPTPHGQVHVVEEQPREPDKLYSRSGRGWGRRRLAGAWTGDRGVAAVRTTRSASAILAHRSAHSIRSFGLPPHNFTMRKVSGSEGDLRTTMVSWRVLVAMAVSARCLHWTPRVRAAPR